MHSRSTSDLTVVARNEGLLTETLPKRSNFQSDSTAAMTLMKTTRIMLVIACALFSTISGYKVFLGKVQYKLAVSVGASFLLLNPAIASAQVDCNRNCYSNCTKVAPGSVEYCKSSCTEYCEQTDR